MVRLVTAAGESQSNLALVSKGVLSISSSTGTSLKATGDAMYYVESAGFHGAKGLEVLKAAAQGAKVEGADTKVVADALTTALTDLGAKAGPPAQVMSQLVATVAHGKMTMDDLAGSLHSVLPNAAAIGISFAQVTGAIATMTAQGISADQATQNLNHAILSLANPTAVQTKAMAAFGLNSSNVAKSLGKLGLTGTLEELSNTITSHMGPAGLTITAALNSSQIAAGKVTEGYKALTPVAQKYFDALVSGAKISKTAQAGTAGLTLAQDAQVKQLVVLYKRANGFSDLLKSSSPDALTYAAALSKMTGGATGLQVALHLTGGNMTTFKSNVQDISKATSDAGGNVNDFATKQKNLNQKLDQLKVTASNLGVEFGTHLIPVLTKAADFTLKHQKAAEILIGSIIGLKIALVAFKLAQETATAVTVIGTGVQKLFGTTTLTSATAVNVETAALSRERTAGIAANLARASGTTALTAGTAAATANASGVGKVAGALKFAGIAAATTTLSVSAMTTGMKRQEQQSGQTESKLNGYLNETYNFSHGQLVASNSVNILNHSIQILQGKTIYITTKYDSFGMDQFLAAYQHAASLPPISNKLPGAPGLPSIPGLHAGGGYLTPGWNTYDPRGETLVFNGGGRNTKVLSASATRAAGGGGGTIVNIDMRGAFIGQGADKQIVGAIEKHVGMGGTVTISKGIR
jgi:hypothetical protein